MEVDKHAELEKTGRSLNLWLKMDSTAAADKRMQSLLKKVREECSKQMQREWSSIHVNEILDWYLGPIIGYLKISPQLNSKDKMQYLERIFQDILFDEIIKGSQTFKDLVTVHIIESRADEVYSGQRAIALEMLAKLFGNESGSKWRKVYRGKVC